MENVQVNQCLFLNEVEEKAEMLRKKVLNAEGSLPREGNKWYISSSCEADGDGASPETPWRGIEALEKYADRIAFGDSVLFKRGDLFRGNFIAKSGVYYGAYGKGEKPCFCGSDMDHAGALWKSVGENIWYLEQAFETDVGLIVFDNGKHIGYKRSSKAELTEEFDFYCDHEDENRLYLYSVRDPALFESVEIGTNKNLIWILENSHDVTIENLSLKYSGAHGIRALDGVKNISVRNCVISYMGGCYITGYKDGKVRYGNGIEFWQGCENIRVEDCWIHNIYDSGISHQGHGNYVAKNLNFCNNLIEYCGMGSIEYWLWNKPEDKNWAENVTYSDNIMRFAGYGFGGIQRPDKVSAHILSNGNNHNRFIGFHIKGNIFDRSTCCLLEICSREKTYPELCENTYIQNSGMELGTYADSLNVISDDSARDVIFNEWGDVSAKVFSI